MEAVRERHISKSLTAGLSPNTLRPESTKQGIEHEKNAATESQAKGQKDLLPEVPPPERRIHTLLVLAGIGAIVVA